MSVFFNIVAFIFIIFRMLKFLAFVQQKEYRLDRILSYFYKKENFKDFFYFFPNISDLKQKSFKRPKFTYRIIFISLLTLFLIFLFWLMGIHLIFLAILLPFLIFTAIAPSVIFSLIITKIYSVLAEAKIKKAKPIVIGITGSYGKSTTKALLDYVLSTKFSVFSTPKSYNTKYSICKSVVDGYTNQEIAIIEFAAYKKGEIASTARVIKPNMAIITGLTHQHLHLFGSIDDVISAKAELVQALSDTALVVCNAYKKVTKSIVENGSIGLNLQKIFVDKNEDYTKTNNFYLSEDGYLNFELNRKKISTKLVGLHNEELIKIVVTVAKNFGITDKEISKRLQSFEPDERFIFIRKKLENIKIIDDGKTSNKVGFLSALNIAKNIKSDYKILLTSGIVDLGSQSSSIHLEIAKESKNIFDKVFYFGTDGKEEFKQTFKEKFHDNIDDYISYQKKLDKNKTYLFLIEGFIPKKISKLI